MKKYFPLLLLLSLSACRIDPPLYMRPAAVDVIVKVLWKAEVYPDGVKPDGVTLYFFKEGEFYMQHSTAQVDSCMVKLEPGSYRMYMISQSPDEYGKMDFFDMTDFENATVSAGEAETKWYSRADSEVLIQNPEMMTVGVSEAFEVSEDIVNELIKTKADPGEEEQPETEQPEGPVVYYTIRVPVDPVSIVSQFWVTIYSDNADMLKSVRATTSGMARTFNLTKGTTGDEEGTQVISEWTLTLDDPLTRVGHLDGKVTTFGFPRGELPSKDRDPSLNVSTLLVDNQTIEDYTFYVGDKITLEDPPEGYRALYRLVFGSKKEPAITPAEVVPPEGEPSGFDATVSDWEEGEEREIDM